MYSLNGDTNGLHIPYTARVRTYVWGEGAFSFALKLTTHYVLPWRIYGSTCTFSSKMVLILSWLHICALYTHLTCTLTPDLVLV